MPEKSIHRHAGWRAGTELSLRGLQIFFQIHQPSHEDDGPIAERAPTARGDHGLAGGARRETGAASHWPQRSMSVRQRTQVQTLPSGFHANLVHVREELIDRETLRIRGERFHVIGRMASPHWYCRTRDRFEMVRPK